MLHSDNSGFITLWKRMARSHPSFKSLQTSKLIELLTFRVTFRSIVYQQEYLAPSRTFKTNTGNIIILFSINVKMKTNQGTNIQQ